MPMQMEVHGMQGEHAQEVKLLLPSWRALHKPAAMLISWEALQESVYMCKWKRKERQETAVLYKERKWVSYRMLGASHYGRIRVRAAGGDPRWRRKDQRW